LTALSRREEKGAAIEATQTVRNSTNTGIESIFAGVAEMYELVNHVLTRGMEKRHAYLAHMIRPYTVKHHGNNSISLITGSDIF